MPRYIDADALLKGLELSIKSWSGDCNSNAPTMVRAYQDVVYRVKKAPTADVAPRAEVERLTVELQAMRGAANSYKMHYENAKAEVAREIFEEIDKYAKVVTKIAQDGKVVWESPISWAEIKKKYTEENNR